MMYDNLSDLLSTLLGLLAFWVAKLCYEKSPIFRFACRFVFIAFVLGIAMAAPVYSGILVFRNGTPPLMALLLFVAFLPFYAFTYGFVAKLKSGRNDISNRSTL